MRESGPGNPDIQRLFEDGAPHLGPLLGAAIVVGLTVSIFQAATQIHEASLAFVPKILAIIVCLIILSPWMLQVLVAFTTGIISNIPVYVR